MSHGEVWISDGTTAGTQSIQRDQTPPVNGWDRTGDGQVVALASGGPRPEGAMESVSPIHGRRRGRRLCIATHIMIEINHLALRTMEQDS
jgi:hypothetical protein